MPLQKLLKWKLSSITPIVVRRTIQNSGFKLVRSELSLVNNSNNPSVTKNQNAISLQHHCGVTPPINDAFSGSTPVPNELMMLPRFREFVSYIFLYLFFESSCTDNYNFITCYNFRI